MAAPPFRVRAIYEYKSDHDDDLKFTVGQIIHVTELEGEDWYVGEYTDASGGIQQGLFPTNFVERLEPETPSRPIRSPPASQRTIAPVVVTAPLVASSHVEEDTLNPTESVDPKELASGAGADTEGLQPQLTTNLLKRQQEPPVVPNASGTDVVAKVKSAPPVAPKSNSFKDRIAAFNKAEQQPIKPFQPGKQPQAGGFIKKPFVAPPPSSTSYIQIAPKTTAVQRPYLRDEDPEILERVEQDRAAAEAAGLAVEERKSGTSDDQDESKPMSLKERMALLQEQQRLQAERSGDITSRKEKPAAPKKQPISMIEDHVEASRGIEHEDKDSSDRGQDEQDQLPSSISARRHIGGEQSNVPPIPQHELVSGGEEADQSAADDLSEDDAATIGPIDESSIHHNDSNAADKPEEEDVLDEEEARKQRLRERMARLAAPQGAAGIAFNPFGPQPVKVRHSRETQAEDGLVNQSKEVPDRVAIMPLPFRQDDNHGGLQTDSQMHTRNPHLANIEDETTNRSGSSRMEQGANQKGTLSDRSVGTGKSSTDERQQGADVSLRPRNVAESAYTDTKKPNAESLATSTLRSPADDDPHSPGPGSESDDEMSLHALRSSTENSGREIPPRPQSLNSPDIDQASAPSTLISHPTGATPSAFSNIVPNNPSPVSERRISRAPPPIPGQASNMNRPPPPPPPLSAVSTANTPAESNARLRNSRKESAEEDGESDYEGDYDTDIASGDTHKDALKSYERGAEGDRIVLQPKEDRSLASPHREVPPIPASDLFPTKTMSGHPQPPSAVPIVGSHPEPEYDPYRHKESSYMPNVIKKNVTPSTDDEDDDSSADEAVPQEMHLSAKAISRAPPPPPISNTQAVTLEASQSPGLNDRGRIQTAETPDRDSFNGQRLGTGNRRSIEHGRSSADLEQIAADIELDKKTPWWTADRPLPHALKPRDGIDILAECEQTIVSRRDGRSTVSKDLYVLYFDYSQSVFTIKYDSREVSEVVFDQRHEPPPPKLRQDQLEVYWQRFGAKIGQAAKLLASSKKDGVQGDGSPHSLPFELIKALPGALVPVGCRAYGALVYANLANASTMQFDEIRTGDIITLRNARFEGHHGAIKQKYKQDYGANHVAVVDEWDGTKRTVRAWEQGRERKGGVRSEKFRLADLRSGEVRIWRVIGRDWVGWESSG